jgi:hypothetical protein
MTIRLSRFLLLAALGLPLAGCLSYTEAPKQPAPVVVTAPPPPSGSVVVQPSQ